MFGNNFGNNNGNNNNGGFNANNGGAFNGFQRPTMMQNPMMQQQQAMMQQMMQQQDLQDNEGLSSSIARDIINVILGSNNASCCLFQDKLDTAKITERLTSNPSILANYRSGLTNVLQGPSLNGASYKTMENGALRVLGGSDRVMDFMEDKIISYYPYDGIEAESMRAFFEGKKCYKYNSQNIYFDLIKCEYDLNNKTYKIIITLQGTEKEVIFEGDDVSKITGVSSGAHGFNVVVNGVYVSMSNKIDEINENFKDKKLNITAKFVELNKENTTHANNNIDNDNQDKSYDNFNYEKTNSGCSCFNWCSDCLKSCKEKFRHNNEYV